jgi:hypothetical protein
LQHPNILLPSNFRVSDDFDRFALVLSPKRAVVTQARRFCRGGDAVYRNGGKQMKPIRFATIGIVAAGAMFGAVAASAAPIPSLGNPAGDSSSNVVKVGCWWSYGQYYCRHNYYHHNYRRHYRYNY